MEKYLQNPELLCPTEFVTTWRHAKAIVYGKELCKELTGYYGPFMTRQQQGRSASLSVVHADQEVLCSSRTALCMGAYCNAQATYRTPCCH